MKKLGAVVLAAATLSGCGSAGFPGFRPTTYSTPGEARIYLSDRACPHTKIKKEALPALLAPFAIAAVSNALSNFGNALTEAAKGGTLVPAIATLNFERPPGVIPQCLYLVRADFHSSKQMTDLGQVLVSSGENQADVKQSYQEGPVRLPSVARLDHLIEIQLIPSASNKAITMAPVFIWFNNSIDGSDSGTRDISVAVKFNAIGTQGDFGNTFLLPHMTIGEKRQLIANDLGRYQYESAWFSTFNPPAPAAHSNPPAPPGQAAKPDPATELAISMSSTVVETRPERAGLAFVASVFTASEPSLNTAIKPLLDPATASAAQTAAATAGSTAQSTAATARIDFLTYCQAASSGSDLAGRTDRLRKSSDAETARVTANNAADAVHLPPPFPTAVNVSDRPIDEANGTFCQPFK